MKISFWLIPDKLHLVTSSAIIRTLAAMFEAPVFKPHVTVFSGDITDAERAAGAVRRVAREFSPITLHKRRVSISDRFTKTVYVEFADDETLARMSAQLRLHSGSSSAYELQPHMSLIYASLPHELKREMAAAIEGFSKIRFTALHAVATGPKTETRQDVERWRTIAEARLRG